MSSTLLIKIVCSQTGFDGKRCYFESQLGSLTFGPSVEVFSKFVVGHKSYNGVRMFRVFVEAFGVIISVWWSHVGG